MAKFINTIDEEALNKIEHIKSILQQIEPLEQELRKYGYKLLIEEPKI